MTEATLSAGEQTAADRAIRDLILVLADSKRLLGTRYAEWILGAPELETGIACASMAQDEWGHARLLYALLKEFGEDVDRLEHGREPSEYCNLEVLDRAPESWPEFVIVNALVDIALTIQLEALTDSSHAPLRQRVGKLIDEERFHAAHALAWARRLGTTADGMAALARALDAAMPVVQRWFGAEGAHLRALWLQRIQPVLVAADRTALAGELPDFVGFNPRTRRVSTTGPDAATIKHVRGDKNRAFLMD
ncbi:MAG TPA: Phenylacetic acid catabolic protein [Longimicrobiales bacterium]|nr:Phenylacetic acid catabolic protein [Longimicrobiales bacterium]